jgi:multicomponent Na+:H+ antiporter subunit C
MILLLSVAVGALFGAGAFLLLERDLVRMAAGVLLMSHSGNLLLMSSGLLRGEAPIHPLPRPDAASDPLTQALTLTAIVISFAVAALLLALVLRVQASHGSIDVEDVVEAEQEAEEEEEGAAGGAPGGAHA